LDSFLSKIVLEDVFQEEKRWIVIESSIGKQIRPTPVICKLCDWVEKDCCGDRKAQKFEKAKVGIRAT
jgi:hypothetical protein